MSGVSNWIMVVISFISLVLGVLVPLCVSLSSAHKAIAKELSEHKTHVAEIYATKNDVKDLGDRMERQMKDGFENLKQLLTTNIKNKDTA